MKIALLVISLAGALLTIVGVVWRYGPAQAMIATGVGLLFISFVVLGRSKED